MPPIDDLLVGLFVRPFVRKMTQTVVDRIRWNY